MTSLSITPYGVYDKRAAATGVIAVGEEAVAITLVGLGSLVAGGKLRVRLMNGATEIARFPAETGDVFAVSGSDATCALNVLTTPALAMFTGCGIAATKQCNLYVELTDPNNLFCRVPIIVHNWHQVSGEDVPFNFTDWEDDLAALEATVLANDALFDAHAHTGADGTEQVSHTSLTDIGTQTHAQLEATDAALGVRMTAADGDIDDLEAASAAADALIAGHNHNGVTSQQLSHAGLSNIGTRTHAQLEADIGAVDDKADATDALMASHAHTGADGSAQVALASTVGYAALLARLEEAEAALVVAQAALDGLAAIYLAKPATGSYTVTAPAEGTYRNINEDMTGDQLARCIPTIVQDLIDRGVL